MAWQQRVLTNEHCHASCTEMKLLRCKQISTHNAGHPVCLVDKLLASW
jgi:hypothetical protein